MSTTRKLIIANPATDKLLTPDHWRVIQVLCAAGRPLTAADIADATGLCQTWVKCVWSGLRNRQLVVGAGQDPTGMTKGQQFAPTARAYTALACLQETGQLQLPEVKLPANLLPAPDAPQPAFANAKPPSPYAMAQPRRSSWRDLPVYVPPANTLPSDTGPVIHSLHFGRLYAPGSMIPKAQFDSANPS